MTSKTSNSLRYPLVFDNQLNTITEIEYAEGIFLYDKDKKKYMDAISGLWNVPLGYNVKKLNDRAAMQLNKVPYVNLRTNTNREILDLSTNLMKMTDYKFNQVMYTTSGSEGIELAIKLSRKYHHLKSNDKKKFIISFDMSYHGTTISTMSLSGVSSNYFDETSPLTGGVKIWETLLDAENEENYIDYFRAFIEKNKNNISAVVLEPVMGVAGAIKQNPKVIDLMKEIQREYDILVICDEVSTGFYRTGTSFGYKQFEDFYPDIICLSKAITNGYLPFGAVLLNEKVSSIIDSKNLIPHFSTQNGNPICCAVANEVIHTLEEENFKEIVHDKSVYFKEVFTEEIEPIPSVKEVRYEGLMIAIELQQMTNDQAELLEYNALKELVYQIKLSGAIVYPYSTKYTTGLLLLPPYVMSEADIEDLANILSQNLRELE